jgi:hypothetical protein
MQRRVNSIALASSSGVRSGMAQRIDASRKKSKDWSMSGSRVSSSRWIAAAWAESFGDAL